MPRVSVLTPIYNTNPQHLRECIDSILNQTFTDFEFLILNDSPQNTEIENIVKSYTDTRIKYYKNDKNLGISASRNKLLSLAQGEYLAIFDHDDISVPNRLEQQVKFLDEHPHIGVVSGNMQYFGNNNDLLSLPESDTEIKMALTEDCSIAHTAAMIRKRVLTDNNIEYEEFFSPAEDYRLWTRLMAVTNFHNIQTVLVKYRWDANNTTIKQKKQMARTHDAIQIETCNKFPAYRSAYIRNMCNYSIFRLRLFGFIPLIKIKRNTVYLFEVIPLFKLFWK